MYKCTVSVNIKKKKNMASHRNELVQELWLAILLLIVVDISEEISVTLVNQPIRAKDSDVMVELPCDFKMTTYETPQITWFQEKVGQRIQIMQYDIHNRLSSYGEFKNRVARGDRGSLVLFQPRSEDSGNYTCEVEVDNETPSWVKSTITLQISDSSLTDRVTALWRFVMISLYWLVSVVCAFLTGRDPKSLFRNACTKQQTTCVFICLVIICAMGLTLAGAIFAASAFHTSLSYNYILAASLGTGIPGSLMFLAVAFMWPCFPENWWCKKKYREIFDNCTSSTTAGSEVRFSKTEVQPEESALLYRTTNITHISEENTKVTSVQNPDGDNITGMTSLSYKNVYVTTTSSLYNINVDEEDEKAQFKLVSDREEQLLSLGNFKDGLLVCARQKTDKEQNTSYFIHCSPENKLSKIFLNVKSTILWCQADRANRHVYTAFSDPDHVVKLDWEKKNGPVMWKNVLKKPVCIVRNSRGQLIVADAVKNDLFVFDETDDFLSTMKVSVPREHEHKLNGCNRLAVAPDDTVFASSPFCDDVLVFAPDFRFRTLLRGDAFASGGISCLLADSHSLYVADGDCIHVVSLTQINF